MCWVALDCAIELAGQLDAQDRVERWSATREQIREAILTRGRCLAPMNWTLPRSACRS
jgi:GH15 family glucan-1,4-alpha-glucosidase